MKKVITSHLHARVRSLSEQAIAKNLITSCVRIEGTEDYWITRQGSIPMRCTAVFAGVFLLEILK